ncbi:MAG: phage holin family protein [Cyanobacteria bacterium]|nr:phage holin family protein [Cyanobacteriota bacterium]MDW8200752.1 phage holin family protein [Cyanobacteriota bacterium SKYGB_h_bin112]
MSHLLITWVLATAALLITSYIVPGIEIESLGAAFIGSALIGLVNAFIKPVFVALTIPITVVTLGLFLLVVNPLMLWLAGSITPKFRVRGFIPAVLGSLGIAIVSAILNRLLR